MSTSNLINDQLIRESIASNSLYSIVLWIALANKTNNISPLHEIKNYYAIMLI